MNDSLKNSSEEVHPSVWRGVTKFFSNLFSLGRTDLLKKIDVAISNAADNGVINKDIQKMLKGVMSVSQLKVRDVMIPKSQISFIEIEKSNEEIINFIIETGHSRYPVIDIDGKILGVLFAKDILQIIKSKESINDLNIIKILKTAQISPETKRVDAMLQHFKTSHFHLSLVVNEFGEISGLITIEDILELIVGDINDEYDQIADNIVRIGKTFFDVSAVTTIEEFNEVFGTSYSDEEFDTIGGFLINMFGYLPKNNEVLIIDDLQFKIKSADSRKLNIIRLRLPKTHIKAKEIFEKSKPTAI